MIGLLRDLPPTRFPLFRARRGCNGPARRQHRLTVVPPPPSLGCTLLARTPIAARPATTKAMTNDILVCHTVQGHGALQEQPREWLPSRSGSLRRKAKASRGHGIHMCSLQGQLRMIGQHRSGPASCGHGPAPVLVSPFHRCYSIRAGERRRLWCG
jgi:hypothetical protein